MFKLKLHRTSAWHARAAVACFVLAVIAAVIGSLLTTNAILNAHAHPTLHAVGVTLLLLALPIAILGAHCLDMMDRRLLERISRR